MDFEGDVRQSGREASLATPPPSGPFHASADAAPPVSMASADVTVGDALGASRALSVSMAETKSREKKKVECAWLLLLSYASGLLASSSDSQSSTLVASGVLALRALLLCFARAPALLTRPPAETEHKKQKKARCAWLLLLSNPSSLLASLALYSLPSYHSGSSALVASGVFGLEAVHRPACC